jgi:hypothetical protein
MCFVLSRNILFWTSKSVFGKWAFIFSMKHFELSSASNRLNRTKNGNCRYRAWIICTATFILCLIAISKFGVPSHIFDPDSSPNEPLRDILVIVRSFEAADQPQLLALLHTLRAQTYPYFQVWVVNSDDPRRWIFADEITGLKDSRLEAKSFPCTNSLHSNSYGYFVSETALNSLLSEEIADGIAYVLITNGDNLYHPTFLETTLLASSIERPTPCVVGTDFVSRYHSILRNRSYGPRNQIRPTSLAQNGIDLGSALISLTAIKRAFPHGVRFKKESTKADYFFFSTVSSATPPSCWFAVHEMLFVHQ